MLKQIKLSRRSFLKATAITVLGAAIQACRPAAAPTATPQPVVPTATPKPAVPTATPKPAEPTKPAAPPTKFNEAPMLAELVKAGKLPPLDQRLPPSPLVIQPLEEIGTYGGTWRTVNEGDGSGWFRMTNWVEPFLRWNRTATGHLPCLLESWEWNKDATEVVTHLRKGIKWSDGQPLTVADFLFWWEDCVGDKNVGESEPAGTRVKGELMKVEKVDDYTLRFKFAGSHPLFLPYTSRGYTRSSWWILPAHYMKQFHPKYNKALTDAKALLDRRDWRDRYPDMPVFTAWKPVEWTSGQRHLFERNPYYWKVDPNGNQLPYIDKVDITIVGGAARELTVMKGVNGELDCQFRDFFPLKNVPLLKENEKKGDYRIIMWRRGDFGWPALLLGYDYPDSEIVDLMYDKRFRQALSWAINRNRINDVVSLGMAKARNAAMSADSPEFQTPEGRKVYEEWSKSYADYQPETAKKLLGEVGVKDVNNDNWRERPNGKPLELIIDVIVTDQMSVDASDLIKQDWEAIGLKTTLNVADSTIVTGRANSGQYMIWARGSNCAWGLISAPPHWTPIEYQSYAISPRIGWYYQTAGKQGVPPRPGSMLEKLQQAYTELVTIVDEKERTDKLLKAYRIHIDEGPINIGTIGEHVSPILVKNNFRNVSDFGVPGPWDLGYPGTVAPEQFFFKK